MNQKDRKQGSSLMAKAFEVCYFLTLTANLIIYIAQPYDISILVMIASRCFMLSNLLAFIFAVFSSMTQYIPYKTNQIITIAFMIGFSIVSFLLSGSGGIYLYIIRLWCYLALPIYFLYIDYLKPNKTMINFTFVIFFLISINFILLSFTKYRYAGYENFIGTKSAWLTLGYDNPNQTGMYLLITLIILYCAWNYYTKKILKALILIDILYMGKLLFETSSRTCILVGILITAAVLLKTGEFILYKKRYTVSLFTVTGCLLLPTAFLFLYPYLYNNGLIRFFEIGGKTDFSSRSIIFSQVLSDLKGHFLFGDFSTYLLQNTHNGILSVLSSLGIVGLIAFYIYYFRAYFNMIENGLRSRAAYTAFIGLLGVFIHASAEGALITGGSMYAGTLSVLIFLAKLDWEGVKNT